METISKKQLLFTALAFTGIMLISCSGDEQEIIERNQAPVISEQSFEVDENSPAGSSIGIVLANDPNEDDLIFSIMENSNKDIVEITPNTGELKIKNNEELDYESMSSFKIVIQVSDGELTVEGQVTININDVVEFEDNSEETCSNSAVFDPNFTGTACCTQRNSEQTSSNTLVYEYFTNLPNPNIEWTVNSGDMEIISGANANVVTIRLGDSFTEGEVFVLGTGTDEFEDVCGHPISISKQ